MLRTYKKDLNEWKKDDWAEDQLLLARPKWGFFGAALSLVSFYFIPYFVGPSSRTVSTPKPYNALLIIWWTGDIFEGMGAFAPKVEAFINCRKHFTSAPSLTWQHPRKMKSLSHKIFNVNY
jgi:hypothetical protein